MRYGVTGTVVIRCSTKQYSEISRQIPYFEVFASSLERAEETAFEVVNPAGLRPNESKHLGYEFSVTVAELSKE
jgi:hypothetical protein